MDSLFCSIFSVLIFRYINKIVNFFKKIFIMAFYFGYGSNMSQVYLEKVRYVYPKKSIIGYIKDYALKINLKGPNFVEPGFANISYQKGSKVEGVLHEISDVELKKIIASAANAPFLVAPIVRQSNPSFQVISGGLTFKRHKEFENLAPSI